jgi:hypothetical protein
VGFRDPLTTSASVDTGVSAHRVKITQAGDVQGGGQVLLYGSSGQPAVLAAGSDDQGVNVALASPAGVTGAATKLLLRGPGVAGGEAVNLFTDGSVTLTTGPITSAGTIGRAGTRAVVVGYSPGWAAWNAAGYANLTFTLLPDGTVEVEGLAKYVGGTGATTKITGLAGGFVPAAGHVMLTAVSNDDGLAYPVDVHNLGAGAGDVVTRRLPTVGAYFAISGTYRGSLF